MPAFGAKLTLLLGALALVTTSMPAQAQIGTLLNRGKRGADRAETCDKGKRGDTARGVVGGLLGGAVKDMARKARLPSFVPVPAFSDQLTESIACRLDPEEQKQAAEATLQATRSDTEDGAAQVGSTASWNSSTRDNVSGTSTVTRRERASGDLDCITVTDVVIVQGEETRADKRMCRAPGSARYSIIA